MARDDEEQAWKDLEHYDINELDTVVGIAASRLYSLCDWWSSYCSAVIDCIDWFGFFIT